MTPSVRRERTPPQFWTTARADFYAADRARRWTARAAWAMATIAAWMAATAAGVLGALVVGAPPLVVTVLAAALTLAVPLLSVMAVTTGSRFRTGAPALTALAAGALALSLFTPRR